MENYGNGDIVKNLFARYEVIRIRYTIFRSRKQESRMC
jgi:hypothetical protein